MQQKITAAYLIPSGDVSSWGKQVNSDPIYSSILKTVDGTTPCAKVQGVPIYECYNRAGSNFWEYVAFTTVQKRKIIAFYSQVKRNQKRNNLFKPAVGRFQSLVWKYRTWMLHSGFATEFILDVLLQDKGINPMVLTDMKQTSYGSNMWVATLAVALRRGYKCYFGLSSPSDARCLIKIENDFEIVDHYASDIVADNPAYAYRCALITKPGVKPESLLLDPKRTLILTNEEAEELGAYDSPKFLTDMQFNDMLDEYYV